MSRHEGVSCDNCLKSNFEGKRFKCLVCYDYDLCESCHSREVTTSRHLASHAMQCILTRSEFDIYYGGETISPQSPPSFVCPYCSKLGFTENLLQEHVTKEHAEEHSEVVCPVCATLPSGDPNLVTEDLAHHLSMEHRSHPGAEDSIGGRHIRRMFYPGRGMRTRNHRSMHFSGGPVGTSVVPSPSLVANNNTSSSVRETMDPIAELLSQLSGVRRSAQQLQQNVSTASQLQELQSQLQLERQRAAEIRQQLERFPNKTQSNNATSQSLNMHPSSGVITMSQGATSNKKPSSATHHSDEEDDSKYLMSKLDGDDLSEGEQEKQNEEVADRSSFVQELILSMLSLDCRKPTKDEDNSKHLKSHGMEKARPVDCPLALTTPAASGCPSSSSDVKLNESETQDLGSLNNRQASDSNFTVEKPLSRDVTEDGRLENSSVDVTASALHLTSSSVGPEDSRIEDTPASSRSAPSVSPDVEERYTSPETGGRWRYEGVDDEDEKDSEDEDDKPPSPTPIQQQRHGLRLQGHVYAPASVRVAGGVSNAALADYGREDVPAGSLNKNIR